jgi:hypothetical protein
MIQWTGGSPAAGHRLCPGVQGHFGMSASEWRESGSSKRSFRKIRQRNNKKIEDSQSSPDYNARVGNKTINKTIKEH